MTDRATTLLAARRERLERLVGRPLPPPAESPEPLSAEARSYLVGEGESLYWNDLEWEHITEEEALEAGPVAQLTFPGFLAFVRGLLLYEVMPDARAPASPRPQVVEDLLVFLARRVVELEEGLGDPRAPDAERLRTELDVTSHLIDLVLVHGLSREDVERVEAAR